MLDKLNEIADKLSALLGGDKKPKAERAPASEAAPKAAPLADEHDDGMAHDEFEDSKAVRAEKSINKAMKMEKKK